MAEVCETSSSSAERLIEMDLMAKIKSLNYNPPAPGEKVFKDECMYCFKTPLHPGKCSFEFSE